MMPMAKIDDSTDSTPFAGEPELMSLTHLRDELRAKRRKSSRLRLVRGVRGASLLRPFYDPRGPCRFFAGRPVEIHPSWRDDPYACFMCGHHSREHRS